MPVPYPMESFKSFNPLFHIFDLLISESFICPNYSTLLFLPCNSNKRIAIILTIEILHLCIPDPELDPSRPDGIKKGHDLRTARFGDGSYKVGPLPVITGFITPITRVIRTVSHL